MKTSVQIRKQAADLLNKARLIQRDSENAGNESLLPEEQSNWDKAMDSYDSKLKEALDLERQEKAEAEMAKTISSDVEKNSNDKTDDIGNRSVWSNDAEKRHSVLSSSEYRKAFNTYLRTNRISNEYRDMVLGTDSAGGALALPVQLSEQLVVALNNLTFYRDLTNVEQVYEAKSLGVRQMTTQPSDASWGSEIAQTTPDSTAVYARRDLSPSLVSKLVNISIRLVQAAPDATKVVMDRLDYKIAIASENGFLNGTGSNEPLGIFYASANGIPTSQDTVSTAGLSGLFGADDLIDTVYNIPAQYKRSKSFGWIGHRSFFKIARKLKNEFGYLLQPGIAQDRPEELLSIPTYQSEYAPSVDESDPTASQYVACLGDYKYYTWAEVVPMGVQVLVERFADYHEYGYLARYWADGSPVLPQAFTRLQLAAE